MRLSEKYAVPQDLALLYEFLNSLDLRRYVERGTAHEARDELSTAESLSEWMRARSVGDAQRRVTKSDHQRALDLRTALRSFVEIAPDQRRARSGAEDGLWKVTADFPLVLRLSGADGPVLQPLAGSSALGRVLAELHGLSLSSRLDRLKMCASEECKWIFFDRSKPGNRRWCSSALCGNRHKTRSYRQRVRGEEDSPHRGAAEVTKG
jgi:predicted RNA-binding Zn ribbon-like protein